MNNVTIVTAFISNSNKHRKTEEYINQGKKLLSIVLPKVVFIENHIFQKYFQQKIDNYPLTKFIIINNHEISSIYEPVDKMTNFNLNTQTPNKDTKEYICLMLHKTEWLKKTIEQNNCYNTEQFIWIDFGIFHILNNDELLENNFTNEIYKINETKNNKIKIASCWNLEMNFNIDPLTNILWYFLGGIFGGDKSSLIEFSELVKKKALCILNEHNTLTWEVNIWYLVYKENPALFNPYYCDHNITMIQGYNLK
jgi:hypothetical protein